MQFAPAKRTAHVSNVDVPTTGGWRGLQTRGAKGPCSQCGLPADEKASNGKKYCLTCWDEWDAKALQAAAGLKGEAQKAVTIEKAPHLKVAAPTLKAAEATKAPASTFWISLGNGKHEMAWDSDRQCFHHAVQLGFLEEESFQILVNDDSEKVLYPEWPHGSFHSGDVMKGPDGDHRGKSWTIGRHRLDEAEEGAFYDVRLRIKADGSAKYIDWAKLDASGSDAADVQATETAKVCEEAVRLYSQRLAEKLAGDDSDEDTAEPSLGGSGSSDSEEPPAEARLELERDLKECCALACKGLDAEVDSDGEEVSLCLECGLPLGDFGYTAAEGEKRIHGECMAQKVINDMRKEDEDRIKEHADAKKKMRAEYAIGWKVEHIPRSLDLAKKLQCCTKVPQGMCCLVLDRESMTVRLAPTLEPAASVNLPYLAMALQVRLKEGKEPWFSLDPAEGANDEMQVKRFQPAWLAGTRLGEAMFQADYHLKELSMGEYAQPVLGMKSCHDFAEKDGLDKEWSAREWFVINQAQVHISDDDVLFPYVKMGVEAREQIKGEHGLEDAKITRKDHPMVKYAELFTENFDLIAERKSVVFHLREVAKATVMAKYLVDARVTLDECWFNMPEEEMSTCIMEIPQLWNDRAYAKVQVSDGQIRGINEGIVAKSHGVYGGVQLAVPGAAMPGMVPGVPVAMAAVAPTRQAARIAPAVVGVSAMGRLVRAGPGGAAIRPGPKGVDLNLGQFDLSEAVEDSWAGQFRCADPSLVVGGAFWSSLDNADVLKDAEKTLFKAVFNPALSDRRAEGDCFVPPDTCATHLRRLKELVQAEEKLRQDRKNHFFSASFTTESAGPLFPRSWSSSIELAGTAERGALHLRPDFKYEAVALDEALKSTTPAFDKVTEDGMHFRVYRIGSLEVRTVQEADGDEAVGAVLSKRAAAPAAEKESVSDQCKLVKVTEYVERAQHSACGYRYYVVLQTEGGAIVTELLEDGTTCFEAAPADLEERTSLARVLRSANCRAERISVGEMRQYAEAKGSGAFGASARKRFARGVFKRVVA